MNFYVIFDTQYKGTQRQLNYIMCFISIINVIINIIVIIIAIIIIIIIIIIKSFEIMGISVVVGGITHMQ